MAAITRKYVEYDLTNKRFVRRDTATDDVAFNSIQIGGLSGKTLLYTGTGLSMDGSTLSSLGAPVGAHDAATKEYVDAIAQGLTLKGAVRVATTPADLASAVVASGSGNVTYFNIPDGLTTTLSTTVTVNYTAHGRTTGDVVELFGVTPFNGLQTADVTGPKTITTAGLNAFTYVSGTAATAAGVGGDVNAQYIYRDLLSLTTLPAGTAAPRFDTLGADLVVNDRVLIKDFSGANLKYNGIYYVYSVTSTTAMKLSRTADADNQPSGQEAELRGGTFVFVDDGLTQKETGWAVSSPHGLATLGTTPISFVQFSAAGIPQVTLQYVYDSDSDGSDAILTTNSVDGSVVIAGSESLMITATKGLDLTNTKITSTTANQALCFKPNANGAFIVESTSVGFASCARGTSAVDLQQARASVYQVAAAAYSTLGGGCRNQITSDSDVATISGGNSSNICGSSYYAKIGGGEQNLILCGARSVIAGGSSGQINSSGWSAIGGGASNNITSAPHSVIGGGTTNCITGCRSAIGGGSGNAIYGCSGFIGSGCSNTICCGAVGTISGGQCNVIGTVVSGCANHSVIAGGCCNVANGLYSTIGGGACNTAYLCFGSTIAGGVKNIACGYYATVGGGCQNTAYDNSTTVAGGYINLACGYMSTIGGGSGNTVYQAASCATIVGGVNNYACCSQSVILGGISNAASHCGAIVAGSGAQTSAAMDFVVGNNYAAVSPNLCNVHYRVDGCTSDVHVGRNQDQAAVVGASNAIMLHTTQTSNQSKYVAIDSPATGVTSWTMTLPAVVGSAGQFLQQTDASGNTAWTSVPAPTLQSVYDADVNGGDALITTNSVDGSVVIAGTQSLEISATGGLDLTNTCINTTTTNGNIVIVPNGCGNIVEGSGHAVCTGAQYSTIGGGQTNTSCNCYQTIAGGGCNTACNAANSATIGGGCGNIVKGAYAVVAGGQTNTGTGPAATVGGGAANVAVGAYSAVVGGASNYACGTGATALGGQYHLGLSAHCYAVLGGIGALSVAAADFVIGNNTNYTNTCTSAYSNHFRVAGDTSDVHIGRMVNQAAMAGASNTLYLHTTQTSNQASYVGIDAPATGVTQWTMTLPATVGTTGQYLQTTDASGNTTWATLTIPTVTLQAAYDGDADGSDALITTNSIDGSVVIAGTQSLKITAANGLDLTNTKITTTTVNGNITVATNGTGSFVVGSGQCMQGSYSVIGGGTQNCSNGNCAVVSGGMCNCANAAGAFVGGGMGNIACGSISVVGGGSWSCATAANATVGGGTANSATGSYATISGGQSNWANGVSSVVAGGNCNSAMCDNTAILGGKMNCIGCWNDGSTIGGGECNLIPTTISSSFQWSKHSTIAGGGCNVITNARCSFIGGGNSNCVGHACCGGQPFVTIGGGNSNLIGVACCVTVAGATVGGGSGNKIASNTLANGWACGGYAVIAGGQNNTIANSVCANGTESAIVGGQGNCIGSGCTTSIQSFIGGGQCNKMATAPMSVVSQAVIAGGCANQIGTACANCSSLSFIGGGECNLIGTAVSACTSHSVIGGGCINCIAISGNSCGNVIAGGLNNTMTGSSQQFSVIGGGQGNAVCQTGAVVAGGSTNYGYAQMATVSGGQNNAARGNYSVVVGGYCNTMCHMAAVGMGGGAMSTTCMDVVVGNNMGGTGCTGNVHFRIDGVASDVHIGRNQNQAAVAGASNTLMLHTTQTSNQSSYVGIDAPTSGVTSWTMTLPATVGSAGHFLMTDASGNTSWAQAGAVNTVDTQNNATNGVADGNTLTLDANGLAVRYDVVANNSFGSTIAALNIVYINGSTGNKQNFTIANATDVALSEGTLFGITLTSAATGVDAQVVTKPGAIVTNTGWSALTPNAPLYLDATNGAVTQNISAWTTGSIVELGHVIDTKTIQWNPRFIITL